MASVWKRTLTLANFFWVTPNLDPEALQRNGEHILVSTEQRTLAQIMDQVERTVIRNTLDRCSGNKSKAADLLGISRQMLHRKLKAQAEDEKD